MAKTDKEFGVWKGTCLIPRKLSIKRYERGFVVRNLKEKTTQRILSELDTTPYDMGHQVDYNLRILNQKQTRQNEH